MSEPQVFNVKHAQFKIDGEAAEDIGTDGFGITPSEEATIIDGLYGEIGFNQDPKSGFEGTLTLKSSSPTNSKLRQMYKKQRAGELNAFPIEITVDPAHVTEFGFSAKKGAYAWIVRNPEWATDEKEMPDVVWNFIGYGYQEE